MPDVLPSSCRLCLVTPSDVDPLAFAPVLDAALSGGDVASLVITAGAESPAILQRVAELLVPVAQARGVAALVLGDTRIVGRVQADGVHVEGGLAEVKAAFGSFQGKRIVGAGGARSRHEAMELGEGDPDYLFFGRLDGDTDPAIYPKALDLAEWWSDLFAIPAVVMGGTSIASVTEAVQAGVEFVALRRAVWEHAAGPAAAVAEANRFMAGKVVA